MTVYIGTSGWQYSDWKGLFYPEDIKSAEQLAYYSRQFRTVEINSTFYHLPRVSTCEKWRGQVPDEFRFTLKLYRGITHLKRLAMDDESRQQLADFCDSAAALGDKLGMILVQLPPGLKKDMPRLREFLEAVREQAERIGMALPVCLEVRNASWFDEEVTKLLDIYGAGWVINDSPGRWPSERYVTGGTLYVRFHGSRELYRSPYTDEELQDWADFILRQNVRTAWVYFNNTMGGAAVGNAARLMELLETRPAER